MGEGIGHCDDASDDAGDDGGDDGGDGNGDGISHGDDGGHGNGTNGANPHNSSVFSFTKSNTRPFCLTANLHNDIII